MSNSKKYHVSMDDIQRWDDAASRITSLEDLVRRLWNQVFGGGGTVGGDDWIDIFKVGSIEIGTENVPITPITVGGVDIIGPFKEIVVAGGMAPSGYFTGLKIDTLLLGDPLGITPISSFIAETALGDVVIGGPFSTVDVNGTLITAG